MFIRARTTLTPLPVPAAPPSRGAAAGGAGVLVKTGPDVLVSVRRAIGGTDLGQLHDAVEQQFLTLDKQEQSVRSVLTRMESDVIRHLVEVNHD